MLHITLDGLPPTTNHAYVTVKKRVGKKIASIRTLSSAGRKYKKEVLAYLAKTYVRELAQVKSNEPYGVFFMFHLGTLENKTWPDKAATRYRRTDADNRVKLLADTLVDAMGLDDSHLLFNLCGKTQAVGEEYTEAFIWNLDREASPFDNFMDLIVPR